MTAPRGMAMERILDADQGKDLSKIVNWTKRARTARSLNLLIFKGYHF